MSASIQSRCAEVRELLKESFEGTAEWRRHKQEEHPDDRRNSEAAERLERLAASVKNIPERTLEALAQAYDDDATLHNLSEHEGEMMRSVGFSYDPVDAAVFVHDLISEVSE